MDFNTALNDYVNLVQEIKKDYFAKNLANLTVPVMTISKGGRVYKKVVEEMGNGQKSVHSFVRISDGAILKPASWKAPAKHSRGSIYDNKGVSALDFMGNVLYLR